MRNWWREETKTWHLTLGGECHGHGVIVAAAAIAVSVIGAVVAIIANGSPGPGGLL